MGFSFSSYEKVIKYIFAQNGKRIQSVYKEKNKITTIFKALKNKEQPWVPSIKSGYVFRIYKSELEKIIGDETEGMCGYLSVKADDESFKKVLIFSTIMNLPKQFHYSFVSEKLFDKQTLGLYTNNRGNVVGKIKSNCFSRLINKDKIYCSLSYVGEDGEADVTVVDKVGIPFYEKLGMKKADDVMQYNQIEWTEFAVQ